MRHMAVPVTPGFRQVQTRRTFEEVADQVRGMLFGGTLRPGDRLPPERELAPLLGVGRPALREALRALEVSGLVELRKGKSGGAFISSGSQRVVSSGMADMLRLRSVPVSELFEVREWILSSLVRSACLRISADEIQALRDTVDRAELLHEQGRFEERINTNLEFYALVAGATRNRVAEMVMRGLSDALRSLIHEVGSELYPSFFSQRRQLIHTFELRDAEAAATKMAEIVKATERTYQRLAASRLAVSREDEAVAVAAQPAARGGAAGSPAAAATTPGRRSRNSPARN
jgi:GntR family transcriptional repressor for pyruvate dehydrogenase complex